MVKEITAQMKWRVCFKRVGGGGNGRLVTFSLNTFTTLPNSNMLRNVIILKRFVRSNSIIIHPFIYK